MNTSQWFIPYPDNISAERADLSFGLRSSIRFYGDLVAPGIGSVNFVRRLSWSVAAIALAKDLNVNAMELANALEALALKAHYFVSKGSDFKYRGSRAFGRDNEKWFGCKTSFTKLKESKNYVQITYRQNTTRSLPVETGLGLTTSGRFFSRFSLTDSGKMLADAFLRQKGLGRGGAFVEGFLHEWVLKPNISVKAKYGSIDKLLGPNVNNESREKDIVYNRLSAEVFKGFPGIKKDVHRRVRLLEIFQRLNPDQTPDMATLLKELDRGGKMSKMHAKDIQTASSFSKMHGAAKVVLDLLCRRLGNEDTIGITDLLRMKELKEATEEFKSLIKSFKMAAELSDALEKEAEKFTRIADRENENVVREIVKRDSQICQIMDDKVVRGPLHNGRTSILSQPEFDEEKRENDIPETIGIKDNHLPNSIRCLYGIWQECVGR
jgi:hypothetical protein